MSERVLRHARDVEEWQRTAPGKYVQVFNGGSESYWVLRTDLNDTLAAQGLHVVTAAERGVLDAWAVRPCHIVDAGAWSVLEALDAVDEMDLQMAVDFAEGDIGEGDPLLPAMKAELARREASRGE